MNDTGRYPESSSHGDQGGQTPATPGPGQSPGHPSTGKPRRKPRPPHSLPNPMPGVDPQQTPGIDRVPAEEE